MASGQHHVCVDTDLDWFRIWNHSFGMGASDKLFAAMRENPRGDWRLEQLQTVARAHGIVWRQPGTSHCTFVRGDGRVLTVPARRRIKPVYVRAFAQFLSEVKT